MAKSTPSRSRTSRTGSVVSGSSAGTGTVAVQVSRSSRDTRVRPRAAMVTEARGQKTEAEAQFRATRKLDAEEFARLDRIYGRFRRH